MFSTVTRSLSLSADWILSRALRVPWRSGLKRMYVGGQGLRNGCFYSDFIEAISMQRRWTGKNVDLDLLSDCVEDFFKSRSFVTKRTESQGEHTILWQSERTARTQEAMSVKVVGYSDDFTIELKASELTNRSVRLGMLTKPIGGGYFLLKSLKLREALERIEKEFWIYMEDKVAELAGSAREAPRSSS